MGHDFSGVFHKLQEQPELSVRQFDERVFDITLTRAGQQSQRTANKFLTLRGVDK